MNTGGEAFDRPAGLFASRIRVVMLPTITPEHIDVPAVMHDTHQIGSLTDSVDVYEEVEHA